MGETESLYRKKERMMLQQIAIKEPTVEMMPAISTDVTLNSFEGAAERGEAKSRATAAPIRGTLTYLYYHSLLKSKPSSPSFSVGTAFQMR
jgi:hypothetical protein